jgi:phosphoribosylanthranilate isomerase
MFPFLKICGITRKPDALLCAEAGAGALGAIFFEKSPRNVSPTQARFLFDGLPEAIARVGVFVNMPADAMVAMAQAAGLDTVQMHGNESAEAMERVMQAGFHVIKVLKTTGEELLEQARNLPPAVSVLVECGKGVLPGGNAATWNWADAALLSSHRPFAIAGGLHPQNIAEAAQVSHAAGFDVSSGVESAPGIKDESAVKAFMQAMTGITAPIPPFSWKGQS